eukprot:gene11604-12799_t
MFDVNKPPSMQEINAIQVTSSPGTLMEELSSNELPTGQWHAPTNGQGHPSTNAHVINLVEKCGNVLLESSDFEAAHDVEDLVLENQTVFGTQEAGKSQAGDVKGILESWSLSFGVYH